MFGLATLIERIDRLEELVKFLLNRKGDDISISVEEDTYYALTYIYKEDLKTVSLRGLSLSYPISVVENTQEAVILKHNDHIYKLDKHTQQIVNITEFYPTQSKKEPKYENMDY